MPVVTRSRGTLKQTHLEAFGSEPSKESKGASSTSNRRNASRTKPNANTGAKRRKSDDNGTAQNDARLAKKSKQSSTGSEKKSPLTEDSNVILINRAPVLQLWAACVSEAVYPDLPWETHLSIGAAISALCAVSKGRAIGKIEPPSDDPNKKAEKERKKRAAEEGAEDEVHVMGFRLLLKNGKAVVSGKPQNANEELLKKKYGEGEYDRAKRAMKDAVAMEGDTGELNRRAFHIYESFRPSVQRGQAGWGKKGELKLDQIQNVIAST